MPAAWLTLASEAAPRPLTPAENVRLTEAVNAYVFDRVAGFGAIPYRGRFEPAVWEHGYRNVDAGFLDRLEEIGRLLEALRETLRNPPTVASVAWNEILASAQGSVSADELSRMLETLHAAAQATWVKHEHMRRAGGE